jgi:hypothetical protein
MFYVGIVGHRYLGNQRAEAFVSEQCLEILDRAKAEHDGIVAISAIAEGADTLFAEAALTVDIPLEIVRPFESYLSDFATISSRERYEKLRAAARREEKLPYEKRSNAAYKEAMHWVVEKANALVIAWNGLPPEGEGGTGDAIKQATLLNRSWIHLNITSLSVTFHVSGRKLRRLEVDDART